MNKIIKAIIPLAFLLTFLSISPITVQAGAPTCPNCDCDGNGTIEPAGGDLSCFYNLVLSGGPTTPENLCVADFGGPSGVPDGLINGLDIQTWMNTCASSCPGGCDDGIACTNDACVSGSCTYTPVIDGSSCADGTVCNGAETCQAGQCTAGTPLNCDDANACTNDACNPASGCTSTPVIDGSSCADGTVCNGTETCQVGQCAAGTPLNCDDNIACTTDTCVPATGCAFTPHNELCTDPLLPCTANVCNVTQGCTTPSTCGPNQVCSPIPPDHCVAEGICGNEIIDPGEECEFDTDCTGGMVCASCQCITTAVCGDGQVTGNEICDTNGNVGCGVQDYICPGVCAACDQECQGGQGNLCCGDGNTEDPEACDPGFYCDTAGEFPCLYQSNCTDPFVGDGVCQYRPEVSLDCAVDCTIIPPLILADFNSGLANLTKPIKPARTPEFYSLKVEGSCAYSYDRDDALNNPRGYSIQVNYDVTLRESSACKLSVTINPRLFESQNVKPSAYKTLEFYLKGNGTFPKEVKVEMKDATFAAHPVMALGVAKNWQFYSVPIPISADYGPLSEVSIVLGKNSDPKAGVVKLDHLSASRAPAKVWPARSNKTGFNSGKAEVSVDQA